MQPRAQRSAIVDQPAGELADLEVVDRQRLARHLDPHLVHLGLAVRADLVAVLGGDLGVADLGQQRVAELLDLAGVASRPAKMPKLTRISRPGLLGRAHGECEQTAHVSDPCPAIAAA